MSQKKKPGSLFQIVNIYDEYEEFTLDTKWGQLKVEVHEYSEDHWKLVFPATGHIFFEPKVKSQLNET